MRSPFMKRTPFAPYLRFLTLRASESFDPTSNHICWMMRIFKNRDSFTATRMCLKPRASQLITFPESTNALGFESLVAAVLVGDAYQISVEDADDLILGITMLNMPRRPR